MTAARTTRSTAAALGLALSLGLLAPALQARAQVSSYGDKQTGENTGDQLPVVLKEVQVTQHLNAQLPLNAQFVDDTGAPVTLGKYFDGTPFFSRLFITTAPCCAAKRWMASPARWRWSTSFQARTSTSS
jgi:protein SCO1/2